MQWPGGVDDSRNDGVEDRDDSGNHDVHPTIRDLPPCRKPTPDASGPARRVAPDRDTDDDSDSKSRGPTTQPHPQPLCVPGHGVAARDPVGDRVQSKYEEQQGGDCAIGAST